MKRLDLKSISIIAFVVVIAILLFLNAPVSEKKAIELTHQYQEQGLYCCGYSYEKGDNTCEILFKEKQTNKIKKSITTSYSTAKKIYDEYGE